MPQPGQAQLLRSSLAIAQLLVSLPLLPHSLFRPLATSTCTNRFHRWSSFITTMHSLATLILTLATLASGKQSIPQAVPTSITENQTVNWVQCDGWKFTDCGSFLVPLDYTGVTSEILTIPIVRVRPLQDWNGKSVFYNPGGPGTEAIPHLAGSGGQALLK